jgi:hypothetical protein
MSVWTIAALVAIGVLGGVLVLWLITLWCIRDDDKYRQCGHHGIGHEACGDSSIDGGGCDS